MYWVCRYNEMDVELFNMFNVFDNGDYLSVRMMMDEFYVKWEGIWMPDWVCIKFSEIVRLETMYNFMINDIKE